MNSIKLLNYIKRKENKLSNTLFSFYVKIIYKGKIEFKNVDFGRNFEIDAVSQSFTIKLGNNIIFRQNGVIRIRKNASLIIGDNVFFNKGISINCRGNISIGNDCMIGESVKLYDHNHKFRDKVRPIVDQGFSTGSIIIGNNCLISSNVVILKNVTIGNNVVIGANCIISSDIPANTIVKNLTQLDYNTY